MKTYYSKHYNGFYLEGLHKNIPEDAIEVSDDQYKKFLEKQSDGYIVSIDGGEAVFSVADTTNTSIQKEREWRNMQLFRADIELNKVQDSDAKAFGTVAQWREYRKLLRAWPSHPAFPDPNSRPLSPLEEAN